MTPTPSVGGARVVQVIACDLLVRGTGDAGDPKRRVTQFYSLDGVLLAEREIPIINAPQPEVTDAGDAGTDPEAN